MNDPWYWKLGFSTNPFSIKPAALTNEVVGAHLEPILEKIDAGLVQFVEAPLGSGKTTILKGIISRFGGQKKLIYCSCIKDETLEISELLKNATLKGKLFGKIPEGMTLLVDEAQNISQQDAQEIENFIASGNIRAVAFFGISHHKNLLTDELNNLINENVTLISAISPEEAVELVRHRIGNLKLIPDYVIREVYGRSNGNPRRLLQNCEDLCRKAVELSIKELAITDVSTLLKLSELAAPKKKRQKKAPAAKAKKPKRAKTFKAASKKIKKSAAKKLKAEKEAKITASKPATATTTATVTYSGYNLENIRTYEEEMSTVKSSAEEVDEPEED